MEKLIIEKSNGARGVIFNGVKDVSSLLDKNIYASKNPICRK